MKHPISLKAFILPAAAIILSIILAAPATASVTWLSSIPVKVIGPKDESAPARLAVDSSGNIYVTDRRNNKNRVIVFDRTGRLVGAHGGFKSPVGIAVAENGTIYVGCTETGSVNVYNADFTLAGKLGKGDGEFQFPSSVVVAPDGRIYVVDTTANTVKVYNADGTPAFTFGSYGSGDGQFNEPYGIAIDEGLEEVYVTDRKIITVRDPSYGVQTVAGARVQAFSLNGNIRKSFGQFGSDPGQMRMPIGIAADGAGKLYITDANLGMVHVFTTSGVFVETISDSSHVLKTPIGIAIGKNRKMYVASSNNGTLEVYGLDGYTSSSVSAKTLSFSAVAGGPNPAPQSVTLSNSGTGSLVWTATAETSDGAKWLSVTSGGTAGPGSSSDITVSVDANSTALSAGAYSGTVSVRAPGSEEKITVALSVSVPPAVLSVSPASISFTAQRNGPVPPASTFTVKNEGGGTMTWSASTNADWLNLVPSGNVVMVSLATTSFNTGVHTAAVTVTAQGAQGSPATISVTVQAVEAGTVKVKSNIEGGFKFTGAETYSGSGKDWRNDLVKPGEYVITFDHVSGYAKPGSRKFTVETGKETVLTGDYRRKSVPTHVLAGSADPGAEMMVSLYPLDASGKMPRSFTPQFAEPNSLRVASGDLDGSGTDKIVVSDSKRTVKVFSDQGGEALASYELANNYQNAVAVVGDVDNDGVPDILVAAEDQKSGRIIKVLSYAAGSLDEKFTLFSEEKKGTFSMALGDVTGDGLPDLVLADVNSVRAFTIRQNAVAELWTKSGDYGSSPQVAAGDVNNDGISEIAISYDHAKETKGRTRNKESASLISILNSAGEDFGLTIEPFKDLGYAKASTVAMGDIDGDGADELVAGAGPADENEPIVRIFETDGTSVGMMKPLNGNNGVNVGLGTFQ